jgi:nucleoside-diphosphate-sugar epimerase
MMRPGSDPWRLTGLGGELLSVDEVDLRDQRAVGELVQEARPDWVFHLATHGAYSSQTDVHRIMETTVGGTVNLLEACLSAGFEAFVNFGSSSEYGYKDHPPAEFEPLRPNSHYAVAKAAVSMYCGYEAKRSDAHVVTLRLYSVYGPWEEPSRFIPALVSEGLRGELPPLVNPDVARDFVYVDDAVDASLQVAESAEVPRGSIYNLATGTQTTIGTTVEVARRLMEVDVKPEWGSMESRVWDTDVWVGDSTLIREQLGWVPDYDFERGLRATIDWLRSDPDMLRRYRERR